MATDIQPPVEPSPEGARPGEEIIERAWTYYAQGKYSEAEAEFRAAAFHDDRLIDAHYGLAVSSRSQGKTEEAVGALKKAQQLVDDETIDVNPNRRTILRQLITAQLSILLTSRPQVA